MFKDVIYGIEHRFLCIQAKIHYMFFVKKHVDFAHQCEENSKDFAPEGFLTWDAYNAYCEVHKDDIENQYLPLSTFR